MKKAMWIMFVLSIPIVLWAVFPVPARADVDDYSGTYCGTLGSAIGLEQFTFYVNDIGDISGTACQGSTNAPIVGTLQPDGQYRLTIIHTSEITCTGNFNGSGGVNGNCTVGSSSGALAGESKSSCGQCGDLGGDVDPPGGSDDGGGGGCFMGGTVQ